MSKTRVEITGASDDTILVKGDVPGCTSLDVCDTNEGYVELSTGEVFFVEYTDAGLWKIKLVRSGEAGRANSLRLEPASDPTSDNYSDCATITGPVKWVELWEHFPPRPEDYRAKVAAILCGDESALDPNCNFTSDELARLYAIACEVRARNWKS